MDMSLRVVEVWKQYGAQSVLNGVSLDVRAGECVGLLGRNGTGKSTLARIMAGLETPDRGRIELAAGGRALLVQQDFVVWPHLTAKANVELGLGKTASSEDRSAMMQWMERLELIGLSEKKAGTLSHGQQQRVALARALANRPAVMVLDEVFSNLDAASQAPLVDAIRAYRNESGATLIWIGHEWRVMAELCDRIAVLADGVVAQVAAPEIIYQNPKTEDIARLSGALNVIPIEQWTALGRSTGGNWPAALQDGRVDTCVGVRPEDWTVMEHAEGGLMTCIASTHWAPGYVHTLKIENGLIVKVWSDQRVSPSFSGRLTLKGGTCIHVW
jgi:ABC-type Fe3+/spermidine/putrescine transport system ATPase subunit